MDAAIQSWLDVQCRMIAGVTRAVVLCPDADGAFTAPSASWPDESEHMPGPLLEAAERALAGRGGVVRTHDDGAGGRCDAIAVRLQSESQDSPVVALTGPSRPQPQQQAVLQLLQWGSAWYELLLGATRADEDRHRLETVVGLLATSLEHGDFQAAATGLVSEVATRLACERVSLGLVRGKEVTVCAVSHTARLETRSNLMRATGAAMEESLDQEATAVYPPVPGSVPLVTRAQAALVECNGGGSVCSVPLSTGGRLFGALCFERSAERSFDAPAVALCEALAALLGPVLELKHERDRWLVAKVTLAFRRVLKKVIGPRHAGLKLGCVAATVLAVVLATATGTYRISAQSALEGDEKRVVVAPQDGYVAAAPFRAGDVVRAGSLLARLDDKELSLERVKWSSKREQLEKEYRAALAGHQRVKVPALKAQLRQTRAQIDLLDEQLSRTRMTAPFDGVLVAGDLTQSLGSPVEQGQVLFEVAPLDAYRVRLEIDERDIDQVAVGQRGGLALAALPAQMLPLTVQRVLPVSKAERGRNFFIAEASLDSRDAVLRPGMVGVAKIEIERRKLAWIWTHRLTDWLRLALWTWIA